MEWPIIEAVQAASKAIRCRGGPERQTGAVMQQPGAAAGVDAAAQLFPNFP